MNTEYDILLKPIFKSQKPWEIEDITYDLYYYRNNNQILGLSKNLMIILLTWCETIPEEKQLCVFCFSKYLLNR